MAIPGLRPTLEVRAKVRIGEKKKTSGGKEYPAATDHFICDDPDFLGTVGTGAKSIRIFLPFADNAENFSTGLEWWRGKQLTCYSKGDLIQGIPVAYRIETMVADATVVSQEKKGKERAIIACPVRDCPILKKKECKPMGRLRFFIDGIDRSKGVYQLDTKSWNTVEKIEGFLALHDHDMRGVPLRLTVEIVQKGRDKYPVISLEADVEVNTVQEVAEADALVTAIADLDRTIQAEGSTDIEIKQVMANLLDIKTPSWRDRPDFIAAMTKRIESDGLIAAAKMLLASVVDK